MRIDYQRIDDLKLMYQGALDLTVVNILNLV